MADEKDNISAEIRSAGYDIGVEDDGSGNPKPPPHASANRTVNFAADISGGIKDRSDISKNTKTKIGKFLGASTRINRYPIDPNITDPPASLTTAEGTPAALSVNSNRGQTFVPSNAQGLKSTSDAFKTPDAGTPGDANSLGGILSKGKKQGAHPNVDGNNLLASPANVATVNDKYVSAVLKSNRFIPAIGGSERQHAGNLRDVSDLDTDLAYYDRKKNGNAGTINVEANPANKSIASNDMGKIGQTLMLRATGQLGANDRGFNPKTNVAAGLVPGAAQILPVQIINSRDLEARDVLEALINEEVGSHTPGPDSKSWGVLNNQLAPFSGILPTGMIALCIAIILAVQLSFVVLDLIMTLVPDKPRLKQHKTIGTYFKGQSSRPDDGSETGGGGFGISIGGAMDVHSLLGLRDTDHAYNDSFKRGMDEFFGSPSSGPAGMLGDVVGAASAAFTKALKDPGFYVIFCRAIIRSGYGIGKKLSELGSNPMSILQGIANVIDDLRSSKIIAAYNMFAQIGDARLREEDSNKHYLNMDANDDNAPVVYKSRYKSSRMLAWRSAASPSLYVLPVNTVNNFINVSKGKNVPIWDYAANVTEDGKNIVRSANMYVNKTPTANIPNDVAKKMEDALEAEYVPFYFQDMRTKEIISFHAFLTSLNEDYSVNWETTEAYGRVDPVKIYKNTTRHLTLSFRVAALDVNDFDAMWFKINKLLTMIYPQWSKGKQLTIQDDNLDFTQPFSQLISSSPLIRLRVGDVIRSNYSRFNLNRLFNVAESSAAKNLKAKIADDASKLMAALRSFERGETPDADAQIVAKAINDGTVKAYVQPQMVVLDPKKKGSGGLNPLAAAAALVGGPKEKTTLKRVTINSPLKVKEVTINEGPAIIVKVDDSEFTKANGTDTIGVIFNGLSLSWNLIDKFIDGAPPFSEAAGDFLDSKKNPIVKYFEDNTGRGLACTIDSMNMSWLDDNTWATDLPGSKAPKSCVINMGLTAIHDIAPGIDSDGFNRAPVYRVGKQIAAITNPDEFKDIPKPKIRTPNGASGAGVSLPTIPKLF